MSTQLSKMFTFSNIHLSNLSKELEVENVSIVSNGLEGDALSTLSIDELPTDTPNTSVQNQQPKEVRKGGEIGRKIRKTIAKLCRTVSHPNVELSRSMGAINYQRMQPGVGKKRKLSVSYFSAKRWPKLFTNIQLPKVLIGRNKLQHYAAYKQWVRRSANVTQFTHHPETNGLPPVRMDMEEQSAKEVWQAITSYMEINGWQVGAGTASIISALTLIIYMVRYKTCTTELVISIVSSLASVICSAMPLMEGNTNIDPEQVTEMIVEALTNTTEVSAQGESTPTHVDIDIIRRALDCNAISTGFRNPTDSLVSKIHGWAVVDPPIPVPMWLQEYSHTEVLQLIKHPYPLQCAQLLDETSKFPDRRIYAQLYRDVVNGHNQDDIYWQEQFTKWSRESESIPAMNMQEQSSDLAVTVVSIFVMIASVVGISAAFSSWKPLKEIPTAFNFIKSMVNGGGTIDSVRDFVATTFFGQVSNTERTSLLVQESLDDLKKFSHMDITKYCLESDLLLRFDKAIKNMRSVLSTLPRQHPLHHHVTNSILEGEKKYNEFKLLVESTGYKQVPTCFLFSGIAGIGKSSARIKMASIISPHPPYTVESREKYWPQYIGQPVMSVQEFASVASSEKDLVVTSLNSIISSAPFNADGAFEKHQPLRVTTVLIDTNTSPKDILDHSGLIKSSYAAFMERIVWLECKWRGPPEALQLERERRPFKSDMSHISFIPNRNVEPFDVPRKINWIPYIFPEEYTAICERWNASLPSILDPNGNYEPRILNSTIESKTIAEWLDFGLTFDYLIKYEAVLRAENALTYRGLLAQSPLASHLNMAEQADNKNSILLYGPPGAGKSYVVGKFVNAVSSNPLINIITTNHARSANPRKINIYILDDLIPEDETERYKDEMKWMEIYNQAPERSLFITCTNLEPKPAYTSNYFDYNQPYCWGSNTTYHKIFNEPGMYRRIGYTSRFTNSPHYTNKYCYEVNQRSSKRVLDGEICSNTQLVREWVQLVNTTISQSGEISVVYTHSVPAQADLVLSAPSYEVLMSSLTLSGLLSIQAGIGPVKIRCSPEYLKEFQDVTTSTFRPPTGATLEESAIHFASIVRSRGFTRTVLVELGNSRYYLSGNEFSIVRDVVPENTQINSDHIVIGNLVVPMSIAIKLAFYPESIQISDIAGIPIDKCGDIANVTLAHKDDQYVKMALQSENKSRRELAQLQRMEKFSAFLSKWGLKMLFGTLATAALVAVVTLMLPRKIDFDLVHRMALDNDYSLFENLSKKDRYTYIEKYGSPYLWEQSRKSKGTKNRHYVSNGTFKYEKKNGVWREYDAETKQYLRSGTMIWDNDTPTFRAAWYDVDEDAYENSTTRRLKNNDRIKYRANYQDDSMNFDEQMACEAYTSNIPLANKVNLLEKAIVNVYSKGVCYGIAVADHYVLCPYHVVTADMHIGFIENNKVIQLPVIRSKRIGTQDLAILQLPHNSKSFPNILSKIVTGDNSYRGGSASLMLLRERSGTVLPMTVGCKIMNEFPLIIMNGKSITHAASMILQSGDGTKDGDCGLPYLVDHERRGDGYLYALHTHGDAQKLESVATMFNRQTITAIINQLIQESNDQNDNFSGVVLSPTVKKAILESNKASTPLAGSDRVPIDVAPSSSQSIPNSSVQTSKMSEQVMEVREDIKLCLAGVYYEAKGKLTLHSSQQPREYHRHTPKLCLCEFKDGKAVAHHNYPNALTVNQFGVCLPAKDLHEQLLEFVSQESDIEPHMNFEHLTIASVLPIPIFSLKKTAYKRTPYYSDAFEIFGEPGKMPVERGSVSMEHVDKVAKNSRGEIDQMYHQMLYADIPEAKPPKNLEFFLEPLAEHFKHLYGDTFLVSPPSVGISGVNEVTVPDRPDLHGSLRGLEMGTSAGFVARWAHHRHLKGDYLETRGAQRKWKSDNLSQGMKSYIDYQRNRLFQGKDIFTIFTSSLKDELLPREKVWKARQFEVADLVLCCLTREVFGLYLARTNTFRAEEHSKVGMDPLLDWDEFEKYHRRFKCGWTGDFSRWDKRVPHWLIMLYADILVRASDDPVFKLAVPPLMRAHSHSFRCVQNLLVEMLGGVPSGTPLTANMNSDLIFILMFIAFCILSNTTDMALFLEHVLVSTYGDDLRVSISDWAKSFFSLRKVSEVLAKFGIVLESDRKDGTIYDYTDDFSECGFISRYPRRVNSTWVGALKQHSILAPLYWEKDRLQPSQFWEVCRNAYQEASMWSEEFGAKMLKFINRICKNHDSIALHRNLKPPLTLTAMRRYLEVACFTKRSAHCLIFEQSNKLVTMPSIKFVDEPLKTRTDRIAFFRKRGATDGQILSMVGDPLYLFSTANGEDRDYYLIDGQKLVLVGSTLSQAITSAFIYVLTVASEEPNPNEDMIEYVTSAFTTLNRVISIFGLTPPPGEIELSNEIPRIEMNEQMKMMPAGSSPPRVDSVAPSGSSARMMNINDGIVNDVFMHAPSDTMTINNTVDSQFQELGTTLIEPNHGLQATPIDYDYDAWTSFWSGSFQFIERPINGSETRNAVVINISTNPNSPRFPGGDSPELQLVKGFLAGHGFSIPHYIIKMAITGTEGLAGRLMFVQVPEGYVWTGSTPTAEEISSSGFPYTTLSFSRDQAHVMELKPIVNSGFANATQASDQVASYTDFYGIIETALQQSFSENPPIATFKAYLQFGSDFRFTTPKSNFLRIVQNAVVPTPQRRLINIFNTAAEFVLNDVNVVIGSRINNLVVSNPAITMESDLPIELVGGVGKRTSTRDFKLHWINTVQGDTYVYDQCDVFASRGFYIPTNPIQFSETAAFPALIDDLGPIVARYPEVYEVPLNEFKTFEWPRVTPNSTYAQYTTTLLENDYGKKVYVCRNAAGCVVIMPTGIVANARLDIARSQTEWFTNFKEDVVPYVAGFGIGLGEKFGSSTVLQNQPYLVSPTDDVDPPALISVTPTPVVVPNPLTPSTSNLYQPLTFAKGTPTFSSPIGSGAFPCKAHNDAYLWALNRLGDAASLTFNLTEPNGSVLAYVKFDVTNGFQVNSTQEFVQLTNPGPLLLTNVTTSSIQLQPTEPRIFKSILAPSSSVIKKIPIMNMKEQMLALGAGLGSGLSAGFGMMNQNEQRDKDRELQKYLSEGKWENQLELSRLSQENRLAYAGQTNVNQMMHGNRPHGNTPINVHTEFDNIEAPHPNRSAQDWIPSDEEPYVNNSNLKDIVSSAPIQEVRPPNDSMRQRMSLPNIHRLSGVTPDTNVSVNSRSASLRIPQTTRVDTRARNIPTLVRNSALGNRINSSVGVRSGGNLTRKSVI